ncbi:MAG TPA: AIR synthase related protein, partial [Solirubrobacteraceae bacterium]|nr:AIR synthase related protein [Solirubrobacteraceae bacterium]
PRDTGAVLACCEKWDLSGAVIGRVTDGELIRVHRDGALVGELPVRALVDECPLYDLAPARPAAPLYAPSAATLAREASAREALLALLASANLSSRRPLFERYDALVQGRTVRRPQTADAAVLALPDGSALAVSIDCNGRRVAADPYTGTLAAVLECAANLACAGAQPLGTTNNLNFGNPEKPHIAWQLSEAVRGLGDACRALAAPIVGGNVSLYNEGPTGPIYPTPVIGMVGRLPDARRAGRLGFARAGAQIAVVGPFAPSLAASELSKLRGDELPGALPAIDIGAVIAAQAAVREAVRAGALSSAHDIAEGGLLVALAECCLAGSIGAQIEIEENVARDDAALFGEGAGGFLVSGDADAVLALARVVSTRRLGTVGGERLRVVAARPSRGPSGPPPNGPVDVVDVGLDELAQAHAALSELFE